MPAPAGLTLELIAPVAVRILSKEGLRDLVADLATDHQVIGPVRSGDSFVFASVSDAGELALDYDTTRLPPKKQFIPPYEELMRFDLKTGKIRGSHARARARVLFGVHACDINALLLMDRVFLGGPYEDPYYKARRTKTAIVGVSCTPSAHCYCNTWGAERAVEGWDLFLTDLGDRYAVDVATPRGDELLGRVRTDEAGEDDLAALDAVRRSYADALPEPIDTSGLPERLEASFDDPMWEEFGERCLSCGACSMVCPTCYCFDVRDRIKADGRHAVRMRVWDSCLSSEFSQLADGTNVRADRASRVKYRYYHKQWGGLAAYERALCVGCGRCSLACKAGIDPREVLLRLQSLDERDGGGADRLSRDRDSGGSEMR